MQQINDSFVRYWGKTSRLKYAQSISTFCPFCFEQVNFSCTQNVIDDPHRKTVSTSGTCSACRGVVSFWSVNLSEEEIEVYMFPACEGYRKILFKESNLPDPLQRAYESTVQAFNSKNYAATAVCCRRTLEGIFKYRLSENDKKLPLAKAIDKIKDSEDLAKPLNNLSHAIRQGGNLGAHFDMEKEPNAEMSEAMVDLLEYLIEYLYTLPNQIERLDNVLDNET